MVLSSGFEAINAAIASANKAAQIYQGKTAPTIMEIRTPGEWKPTIESEVGSFFYNLQKSASSGISAASGNKPLVGINVDTTPLLYAALALGAIWLIK